MKKIAMAIVAVIICAVLCIFTCSTSPTETSAASNRRPHETVVPQVPKEANFCGEVVPLDRQDIYECMDREVISNTFLHSNTLLIIKRSGRIFPQIEPILKDCGVPDDLKYLCVAESNLVPTAKSPVGAAGLWQFMEGTAKEYGLKVNDEIDERLDIEKSTRAACKKLLSDYQRLGSWTLVAAAYNGGLTRVRKMMDQQHQTSYYDLHWADETRRYVFRIVTLKTIMGMPQDYGFDITDDDKYQPIETETLSVATPIDDIAQWAKDHGTTYRAIRELNPWILKQQLKVTRDTLKVQIRKQG